MCRTPLRAGELYTMINVDEWNEIGDQLCIGHAILNLVEDYGYEDVIDVCTGEVVQRIFFGR